MSRLRNLEGQRFGKLAVTAYAEKESRNARSYWLCKCDCGNDKIVAGRHLTSGMTKSCGCISRNKGKANAFGRQPQKTGPFNNRAVRDEMGLVATREAASMVGIPYGTAIRLVYEGKFPNPDKATAGGSKKMWLKETILRHEAEILGKAKAKQGTETAKGYGLALANKFHALKPPKKQAELTMADIAKKHASKPKLPDKYLVTVRVDGIWG